MPAAGASEWVPFGPSGGAVRALAQDPATGALYAGTYAGGILKSGDAGASWTAIAPEIRGQTVNALALDRSAPRTVFAGTYSSGVWRSADGGATWKRVLFGGKDLPDRHAPVNALAIDPANAKVVYAATDTGFNAGVWRSADGGATWTQSTTGLPSNFRLNALALDPKTTVHALRGHQRRRRLQEHRRRAHVDGDRRRAAQGDRAVARGGPGRAGDDLRRHDGRRRVQVHGRRRELSPPAPGPIKNARVYALAIDPSNPAVVWAGAANALLRSQDGGRTWTDTMPDLDYASVRALALDSAQPAVVLAGTTRDGVRRSDNGGKTWTGPGDRLLRVGRQRRRDRRVRAADGVGGDRHRHLAHDRRRRHLGAEERRDHQPQHAVHRARCRVAHAVRLHRRRRVPQRRRRREVGQAAVGARRRGSSRSRWIRPIPPRSTRATRTGSTAAAMAA